MQDLTITSVKEFAKHHQNQDVTSENGAFAA
jgi:hypothetical protein